MAQNIHSSRIKNLSPIWLSLIAHIIFFTSLFIGLKIASEEKSIKSYHYDEEPVYVYNTPMPPMPHSSYQETTAPKNKLAPFKNDFDLADFQSAKNNQKPEEEPNINDASSYQLAQMYQAHSLKKQSIKRLHMIGEQLLDDPLLKQLGRAITSHIHLPDIAKELHLHGTVSIGMMLHPDGDITNIKLLKSSKESMLDVTALDAIKTAAPVNNIDIYLKKEKYLVINIIF